LIPLRSAAGSHSSLSRAAAWLALPLIALLALVAFRVPGVLKSTTVLDELPVASRPAPGLDALADGPDPVNAPADFASFLSARLDAYWSRAFAAMGRVYRSPQLRLVNEGIQIPCFPWIAFEDEAPFYCFLDDTIYLPVPYVADVARTAGAGRMALAYVLAHEYAHHFQHLTGLGDSMEQRSMAEGALMRQVSVKYELQADCLAGVWAASVYPQAVLSRSAMSRAEDTAAQIRDGRGTSIGSHGSLPERHSSFWTGYTSGRASRCKSL